MQAAPPPPAEEHDDAPDGGTPDGPAAEGTDWSIDEYPDAVDDQDPYPVAPGPYPIGPPRRSIFSPVGPPSPETEEDKEEDRSEDGLRRLLGLSPLNEARSAAATLNGRLVTLAVGVVAALTRFVGLNHPHSVMFDETYYVKDAYALWHNGYESEWPQGYDTLFAQGNFAGLKTDPSFVVHPQFGKWLIALGMEIFGPDSSFGWRFMPALAGVLTVLLLTRLTLRLTHSPVVAGLAGLFLAIDGVSITESRIGLLDVFIGFFGLLSVYCLVRDREWSRARLARDLAGTAVRHVAPRAHLRPWLWATGVCLGLTCSIKWSGLYLMVAIGILVVVWDTLALRRVKTKAWLLEGLVARGIGDFVRIVPVALQVYVAGWWSWFLHPRAYNHGWAATQRMNTGSVPRGWLPDSLNDLLQYHLVAYDFHVHLDAQHQYMSQPIGWLVQWRPTSFYWPTAEELARNGQTCSSGRCVAAITSIGNIPMWWSALLALAFVIAGLAIGRRDWRAWVSLIGYTGLYLPWFLYTNRTIFTFYTVSFVPYVALALALGLGSAMGMLSPVPGSREAEQEERMLRLGRIGWDRPYPRGPLAVFLGFGARPSTMRLSQDWTGVPAWRLRSEGIYLALTVVGAAVVFALLWWPLWTGQTVNYDFWHHHMLLPTWI